MKSIAFKAKVIAICICLISFIATLVLLMPHSGTTKLVSLSSDGAQVNGHSSEPSISADGRFVAFISKADNLVSGDTNKKFDVFIRDTQIGKTERVSISSSGVQANSDCSQPSISADGRFVAFVSHADNLIFGDTNKKFDVFIRDTQTGKIKRVSISKGGVQADCDRDNPSISADGRWVTFISDATNLVSGDTNKKLDVFVRDMKIGKTQRISVSSNGVQVNHDSLHPSISTDGRFVAFYFDAYNLMSDDTNKKFDVFVRDTKTGKTQRISISSNGLQANNNSGRPSISANGRFVAFLSYASNLVSGDMNKISDVFVYDRQTCKTQRVSISSYGLQAYSGSHVKNPPSISADGRFVAFESCSKRLVFGDKNKARDVFIHRVEGVSVSSDKAKVK